MSLIKEWFEDSKGDTILVEQSNGVVWIMYKGFKITKSPEGYFIQDVRFSDFYNSVRPEDFEILKGEGFIRGADTISYRRNILRVEVCTKKIERLYTQRDFFKSEGLVKKLRNCQENINKSIDQLFFYKSAVSQYKNKYKLN
ncbi:MAG: hypothetical protein HRU18_03785 [Pseudoalteromonas sp.]|uniref:hypothetical protein n=1 Tax=Pseudoalteromonas sp. TaxID=53249 RepID=UPI001DEE59EB|nr:hypothetical protein [Pseudoalteromonas sp.]NRA77308.1 hypothetical protein [Pseudoalteromonas sp.]